MAQTLVPPTESGALTVEEALRARRSVRRYAAEPLTRAEVSQLLWAAQGTIPPDGRRAAPSAGALYPLETLLVAGEVEGLPAGVYRYLVKEHGLEEVRPGDHRSTLADAALKQSCLRVAPASIIFTWVPIRIIPTYRDRAEVYSILEAGHAAQNLCLQAVSLGLGTVAVGAFEIDQVSELLALPDGEHPLYVVAAGRPE